MISVKIEPVIEDFAEFKSKCPSCGGICCFHLLKHGTVLTAAGFRIKYLHKKYSALCPHCAAVFRLKVSNGVTRAPESGYFVTGKDIKYRKSAAEEV